MSLSIIIKPHSFFFLIIFIFLTIYKKKKINLNFLFWQFFLILILVSLFFVNNFYQFNFFIVNDFFKNTHSISFSNFFSNIILYFGFLGIIFFPLSLFFYHALIFNNEFKKLLLTILFSLLFFLIGYYLIRSLGEMDFGFISQYFSINFINGILSFFAINLFLGFFIYSNDKNFSSFLIIISIVVIIFLLSLTRPSQRYLIYLIPFCFFLYRNIINKNIIFVPTICIFIFLNIFITNNHYVTAFSTYDVIQFLEKNNIDKNSVNYKHLFPHIPVTVINSNKSTVVKKYLVQTEPKSNYVYYTCRGFWLKFSKCNYLVVINN